MAENVEARARFAVKQLISVLEPLSHLDEVLGKSSDLNKLLAAKQARLDELSRREATLDKVLSDADEKAAAKLAAAEQAGDALCAKAQDQAERLTGQAKRTLAVAEDDARGIVSAAKAEADRLKNQHTAYLAEIDASRRELNKLDEQLGATRREESEARSRKAELEAELERLRKRFG